MIRQYAVAHVTTAHPATDNRIFRKECVALGEAALEVFLVAPSSSDRTVHGVRVVGIPNRKGRLRRILLGPWDAWHALNKVHPDLVHVHDPELIPLAVLWSLVNRKPAIFDAHEDLAKQISGKNYIPRLVRPVTAFAGRLLEILADHKLAGIVVATPAIARNFTCAPSALVQNFPWLRDFPHATEIPTQGRPHVAYVGVISEGRGGVEMISAAQSHDRDIVLDLAGPPTKKMADLIAGDRSARISYRGVLPAEEIPAVLSDCQIGLVLLHPLPNYLQSQPTKIFEYMAAARPFIASDFPAWRTLLEKFDCGLFINPLSVSEIQDSINFLIENPISARAMGLRGRVALEKHFKFEAEQVALVKLTKKLLEP